MDFDINKLTIEDHVKLDMARDKAIKGYEAAGYVKPNYATTLIRDVYNQIYEKENTKAFNSGKDGVSETISEKIEFLKDLTELKLYNKLTTAFKQGEESVEFSFHRGIPDKQTAEFFNLEDVTGSELNTSRTNMVRLPNNLHCEKDCVFTMTPQGDSIKIDDRVFGVGAEPMQDFTDFVQE